MQPTFTSIVAQYLDHADAALRHADGTPTGRAARLRTPLNRWLNLSNPKRQMMEIGVSVEPVTIGDMSPSQVGHGTCQAFKRSLRDLSRRTFCDYVGSVRTMIRWSARQVDFDATGSERSLIAPEIATRLDTWLQVTRDDWRITKRPAKKRPISLADIYETLSFLGGETPDHFDAGTATANRMIWTMLWINALTGMRPIEVCRMRLADICTDGQLWEYRPGLHKTAHEDCERTIDLSAAAQRVLVSWCELRQPSEDDWIFPGRRKGQHITRNAYGNAIRRVQLDKRLARWPPGMLRHTTLSIVANRNGIDIARELADHSHAKITRAHYVTDDRRRLRDLIERYG